MIHELRNLTKRPFNVNLLCHTIAIRNPQQEQNFINLFAPIFQQFGAQPPTQLNNIVPSCKENDAMFDMLLEEAPPIVSFHLGLPLQEKLNALKAKGIFLWAAATNLEDAYAIEAAGLNAVVAQGYEAGGHRSVFNKQPYDEKIGTFALVRTFAESNLSIPIITAGGIMDGAGIHAAQELGKDVKFYTGMES